MQVSNEQIRKILSQRSGAQSESPNTPTVPAKSELPEGRVAEQVAVYLEGIDEPVFETPPEMVQLLVSKVVSMPDREDRVAELKARYEAGEYNPTSEEIADAMIRRSIADSLG